MAYLLFSQRSINYAHGTGAQLSYFLQHYHTEGVFNYGYRDPGYPDDAFHLESFWHRVWPFKARGRGFLSRNVHRLPLAFWMNHHLTSRGRRIVEKLLTTHLDASHGIVFMHDENCARRFNSIRRSLKKPYIVVLYDLMHLDEPRPNVFPELSACLSDAIATYSISRPLQDAAIGLGAKNVKRVGFYRPRCRTFGERSDRSSKGDAFRILVMADAKEEAFIDLVNAVEFLNQTGFGRKIEIHFVGNPRNLPSLCEGRSVEIRFYGFVSPSMRDRVVASCDIGYLAGSTQTALVCPLAKYSIPSKIGDFVAFGLPFVGRVSCDSAAHEQINDEMRDFAFVATSGDAVLDKIALAARSPELCLEMSRRAALYADQNLYLPNPTTDALAFNLDGGRLADQ
jgi:hypothetical protein